MLVLKNQRKLEYENGGSRGALFWAGTCSCSGLGCKRGRAQRVWVVEGPTAFCAAQVMSQQLSASYRQPLLAAGLAPSFSREEQSGDRFPHPKQAR